MSKVPKILPRGRYQTSGADLKMSDSEGVDPNLSKALAHPLRVRILQILRERIASPNEMSKDLDVPLNDVSYQVKVLSDLGAIEQIRSEPRQGAVEHFFRADPQSPLGTRIWADVAPALRQDLVTASLDALFSQVSAELGGETFQGREGPSLSCEQFSVDELGWSEVVEILQRVNSQLQALGMESRRRLNGQTGISVVAITGAFEIGRGKKKE